MVKLGSGSCWLIRTNASVLVHGLMSQV